MKPQFVAAETTIIISTIKAAVSVTGVTAEATKEQRTVMIVAESVVAVAI